MCIFISSLGVAVVRSSTTFNGLDDGKRTYWEIRDQSTCAASVQRDFYKRLDVILFLWYFLFWDFWSFDIDPLDCISFWKSYNPNGFWGQGKIVQFFNEIF